MQHQLVQGTVKRPYHGCSWRASPASVARGRISGSGSIFLTSCGRLPDRTRALRLVFTLLHAHLIRVRLNHAFRKRSHGGLMVRLRLGTPWAECNEMYASSLAASRPAPIRSTGFVGIRGARLQKLRARSCPPYVTANVEQGSPPRAPASSAASATTRYRQHRPSNPATHGTIQGSPSWTARRFSASTCTAGTARGFEEERCEDQPGKLIPTSTAKLRAAYQRFRVLRGGRTMRMSRHAARSLPPPSSEYR